MTVQTPFGTFRKMRNILNPFKTSANVSLIEEGARLRQITPNGYIWVVERIANIEGCAAPHARLYREDAPDRIKTLSLDVLLDGQHYRPVPYLH